MTITPNTIIHFWFTEIDRALWFKKDADFDRLLEECFGALHAQASQGELSAWRDTPHGRLTKSLWSQHLPHETRRKSNGLNGDGGTSVPESETIRHAGGCTPMA